MPVHVYALPLIGRLEELGFHVVQARPPDALELLRAGRVDAAIVPLASASGLTVCRGPMVWSRGETMSVAVYSRDHRSLDECRVVAVSGESRTSIAYLRLIAGAVGAGWRIVQARDCMSLGCLLEAGDCALLLGDEALRARRFLEPIADLGGLVRRVLGVDPVYAVTASLSPDSCPLGLPVGEPRVEAVHAVEACRRTGLPVGVVLEYFMRVNLSFNERVLHDALRVLGHVADLSVG